MAEDKVTKVEVVTPSVLPTPTAEEKKVAEAQADQLYGKADAHAPAIPTRADYDGAGAAAQGPNLTKEESEFAAAADGNAKAGDVPEEKIPAPIQASEEPAAPAGKAPKADKK